MAACSRRARPFPAFKHKFDAKYTIDNLNRVTGAQEGHMSSGSIASEYRDELWTLTQTGNWSLNRVDLNGDNDYIDADELDDTRTHAPVNEILTRNTNSAGGVEFTLTYNLRGDLEDEGGTGGYKYVWDAFGRLVEVRRQNDTLLAEYRYNGLNQRITWHYDATGNGTTDGSDPTYHFCYDEKWRIMGTWRGTDSEPKELFLYHNAGLAGQGGSSYIDSVVLRDRDITNGWTGSGDGTREQRHYYAQNWRADVAAVFDNSGDIQEWMKYSSYGIPFLLTPGDFNKDGTVDKDDDDLFTADYGSSNARADLNKDGSVTSADQTIFNASYAAAEKGGRWKLSSATIGNRKGYAGYEAEGFGNDLAVDRIAHVRNRVLHFGLGRWTRRDPAGYVDGASLAEYLSGTPASGADPSGLESKFIGDGKCASSGKVCPSDGADTPTNIPLRWRFIRQWIELLLRGRWPDRLPNGEPPTHIVECGETCGSFKFEFGNRCDVNINGTISNCASTEEDLEQYMEASICSSIGMLGQGQVVFDCNPNGTCTSCDILHQESGWLSVTIRCPAEAPWQPGDLPLPSAMRKGICAMRGCTLDGTINIQIPWSLEAGACRP